MNKILVTIVSIAVLACILVAAAFYINTNNNTSTTSIGTIPIGNIKSDHGTLQAELKKPLPAITNSAMVYTVKQPVVDQTHIKHLTDQFGFNSNVSPVTGPEGQTIINDGDKRLEMFKDGGFYYRIGSKVLSQSKPTNLPGKDQAIAIAEKFLKDNKLYHVNPDSVAIGPTCAQVYDSNNKTWVNGYTVYWSIGYDTIINSYTVVGPGSGLGINVGDNGEILLVNLRLKDTTPYKTMNLKSTDKALSDLVNGRGSVSKASDNGNRVVITNASIGYYMETGLHEQKYIKPVYIFDGDVYSGNTLVQAGGFSAYVPALENESELT